MGRHRRGVRDGTGPREGSAEWNAGHRGPLSGRRGRDRRGK